MMSSGSKNLGERESRVMPEQRCPDSWVLFKQAGQKGLSGEVKGARERAQWSSREGGPISPPTEEMGKWSFPQSLI